MEKITGTLVTGHLGNTIGGSKYRRIYAAHMIVRDAFDHFTTEAIIYARLEWSQFIRDTYSEIDRINYLYEKCFEYDSPNIRIPIIDVYIDEIYGIEIKITQHPEVVLEKEDDGLPF